MKLPTPLRIARNLDNLGGIMKASIEKFEQMTPEQQREHRAAQRRSWVIGELLLENPEMSRDEATRLVDDAIEDAKTVPESKLDNRD